MPPTPPPPGSVTLLRDPCRGQRAAHHRLVLLLASFSLVWGRVAGAQPADRSQPTGLFAQMVAMAAAGSRRESEAVQVVSAQEAEMNRSPNREKKCLFKKKL